MGMTRSERKQIRSKAEVKLKRCGGCGREVRRVYEYGHGRSGDEINMENENPMLCKKCLRLKVSEIIAGIRGKASERERALEGRRI